jgi:hypothetical protein
MPERKPGTEWAYKPVPEWRWGKLGWKFADTVDEYIRSIVGSQLRDKLAGAGVPDVINRPVPVTGTVITIHPRRAVDALLRDFSTSPLGTVSALIGEQATLPSPTPPGSKTPPIAPPEPGEDPEPDPSVPWPGGTPLPY